MKQSFINIIGFLLTANVALAVGTDLWLEYEKLYGPVKQVTSSRQIERFNELGQRTSVHWLSEDGVEFGKITILYNKNGDLSEVSYPSLYDNIVTEKYKYKSPGVIEWIRMGAEPTLFKYNDQGHVNQMVYEGFRTNMTYLTYSAQGDLESYRHYSNRELTVSYVYIRNDKGFFERVESQTDSSSSSTVYREYLYDQYGNWTNRQVVVVEHSPFRGERDEVTTTETRKFEYYENHNQQVEPIEKTPGEEDDAQGSQAHP